MDASSCLAYASNNNNNTDIYTVVLVHRTQHHEREVCQLHHSYSANGFSRQLLLFNQSINQSIESINWFVYLAAEKLD